MNKVLQLINGGAGYELKQPRIKDFCFLPKLDQWTKLCPRVVPKIPGEHLGQQQIVASDSRDSTNTGETSIFCLFVCFNNEVSYKI